MPTVYEPQPLILRTAEGDASHLPERPLYVPDAPDIGFFGRDEALLALDRAFDTDRIVLLHALAGAGKTTTAAEFARWYTATGRIDGVVLWISFEQHMPWTASWTLPGRCSNRCWRPTTSTGPRSPTQLSAGT